VEPKKNNITEIDAQELEWKGPFSWIGYENQNDLDKLPDIDGIYLWTFEFKDGYLVYCAGITKSTIKRFRQHSLEYKSGNYTVFNVDEAQQGKRVEIWHGWSYAREHRDEFNARKEEILNAVEKQLKAYRIFVAQVSNARSRARIEAAIMQNIYSSCEPWAELADRGMHLSSRKAEEIPIKIKNISNHKLYGLPESLEI
jgi:hypothetical protein